MPATKKKTSKKTKKSVDKEHDLIFITSEKCGWCKKAEPVVDALREDGFTITALDMTVEEEASRANEIKQKFSAQCGTPLFIDAVTGNSVCGFREKDVLEKWAKGEEIPKPPPRPQNNRPQAAPQGSEGELLDELLQSYKTYIAKSNEAKGYGVFASENIKNGEVIEESPFVRTQYRGNDLMYPEMKQILYPLPCNCEVCKHRGPSLLLSSGNIQMYNHSSNPDVKFEFNQRARIIVVRAIKDIPEGKEIFHNYGSGYNNFNGVMV